ncbi:MAG: tRNA (adenosine(37)-N6)-threonylcarbamoyltransferase complex dimerization subunit type 1 TsaB [Phycisphaerales bacterium]|nr:tRNA (adenosine(37)-N6)-threonylcarbamoyltransferase complex dimerization subunit type 1 TsaB [Phycisphaerales bacterium]
MRLLAIETSNPSSAGATPGVALLDGDTCTVEPLRAGGRHDDDLMPAIDRLRPGAFDRIAVSVGPGGFTGIRVACTVANMIAEVTGCGRVAVPTALVVAQGDDRRVGVALASKRETSHVTVIERGVIIGASVIDAEALPDVEAIYADQFIDESFRDVARARGVEILEPRYGPAECAAIARGLDPVEVILPIYPREPEAVRKWRELHPE